MWISSSTPSYLRNRKIFLSSESLYTVLSLKKKLLYCSLCLLVYCLFWHQGGGQVTETLTKMHSLVYLTFGYCGLLVTPLSPPVKLPLRFSPLVYLRLGNSAPATLNYLLPSLLQLLLDSELSLPITSPQHMLSVALIVDASCWTLQTLKIPCVAP